MPLGQHGIGKTWGSITLGWHGVALHGGDMPLGQHAIGKTWGGIALGWHGAAWNWDGMGRHGVALQ